MSIRIEQTLLRLAPSHKRLPERYSYGIVISILVLRASFQSLYRQLKHVKANKCVYGKILIRDISRLLRRQAVAVPIVRVLLASFCLPLAFWHRRVYTATAGRVKQREAES